MSSRVLKVDGLTRIEGEGSLYLKMEDGRVADVQLRVFEPPRFFEGLLPGRRFDEVPDITARICGICPVAHQITAACAIEDALQLALPEALRDLRRLIYLGEWIESHALHIFLLHAPDYLGYEDVLGIARDHPARVECALKLKKLGNDIVRVIGGREIHPVNLRVGGFYRLPAPERLEALSECVGWAVDAAEDAVHWCAGLPCPEHQQDCQYAALQHPWLYPVSEGMIGTSTGLQIAPGAYEEHFVEEQVAHSTALHSYLGRRHTYAVGPIARFNLNSERLTQRARRAAESAGLVAPCRNPFRSIVVRAVEMLYACEEAARLLRGYAPSEQAYVEVSPRAGIGCAATEAPRGLLYHRYEIDDAGIVVRARIVPPTAQNQRAMEADLRAIVPANAGLHPDALTWQCEQAVRNYDPCISCAAHFLRVKVGTA